MNGIHAYREAVALVTAVRHDDHEAIALILDTAEPTTLALALAQMVWVGTCSTALVLEADPDTVWQRMAMIANESADEGENPDANA